jgi:O-antigen/teichoic acid export membrane protein
MASAGVFAQLFFVVFSYSFLYTPISMALYVMGKSWVNMIVFSILAIANIGLDLAFIPSYGLWGAFFPVAFVLVLAVLFFNLAVKRFRSDIKIPLGFIARCYLAGLPAALLAVTAYLWDGTVALVFQIAGGFLLLVLGFRVMKIIGEREREIIREMPIPFKKLILALL